MKKQAHTFKHFVIRLPRTWIQQFLLLGERTRTLPQNKKAMRVIAEICIGLMIAIPVAWWAIHTGICPNCDRQLGFGNSEGHLHTCQNCLLAIYLCPGFPHPHLVECDHCKRRHFNCPPHPGRRAEVNAHGIAECLICGEPYRKCLADKIYCPESMLYPRHRPIADKPKTLPLPYLDRQ